MLCSAIIQYALSLFPVPRQLLYELRFSAKPPLISHLTHEHHRQNAAVEVAVKTEDVYLKRRACMASDRTFTAYTPACGMIFVQSSTLILAVGNPILRPF